MTLMIFEKTLEAFLGIVGRIFSLSSCGLPVWQAFLVNSQVAVALPSFLSHCAADAHLGGSGLIGVPVSSD